LVGLSLAYVLLPQDRDAMTFIATTTTIGWTFYLRETLRAQATLPAAQAAQRSR